MLASAFTFLVFVGVPALLVRYAFRVRARRRRAWTPPTTIPAARVHRGGPVRAPPPAPLPPGFSTIETLGVVLLLGWITLSLLAGAFLLLMEVLFDGDPMKGVG